jgi:hypothetical protein
MLYHKTHKFYRNISYCNILYLFSIQINVYGNQIKYYCSELIYFRYQIWSYKNLHFVRNLKKKTKWPTFFTGVGISTSHQNGKNNRFFFCKQVQTVVRVRVLVFKATFNNISIISGRSVLLVEENGENHWPAWRLSLKMFYRLLLLFIVSGDCHWKCFVDCCCCNSFWRLSLKMFCRLLLL